LFRGGGFYKYRFYILIKKKTMIQESSFEAFIEDKCCERSEQRKKNRLLRECFLKMFWVMKRIVNENDIMFLIERKLILGHGAFCFQILS